MLIGYGSEAVVLDEAVVARIVAETCAALPVDGRRVLAIIPDATRSAPIPLLFRLLYQQLGARVKRLDYLIALGTHPPMIEAAIDRLVGVPAAERAARYPNVAIHNHAWAEPDALVAIGTLDGAELSALTGGLYTSATTVRLNRMLFDYDQIIICGPVFPHEVAGFSGGAKYLFPGIAGPEIIDATHWLGALSTSMATIGVKDTLVRRVIHRAAALVERPILCLALVLQGDALHGLYAGDYQPAWSAAADLSARLNITWLPRPVRRVLSMPAERYDDLWTAAKAMYKTEPAIEDGGEVIIYAPHISEISYTHGALIDQVGYHVRDFFLKQWDRFGQLPGAILAHSTHVKGAGAFDAETGIETPRIHVTLATGIPEERCRRVNLGYADYRTIDPRDWADREEEGVLLVPHAGEMLYRIL